MKTTLNITPSPRVLRMLGQIDFAPWQCLAELIDNSIDAFIGLNEQQASILEPRVTISLPSDQELKNGAGSISVKDNGPGMDLPQLENAVKAGYSGNDPVEKMGLFGMGFNISTARLGRKTEVWTTQKESEEWVGVVIDFDELERNRTFEAPIVRREKTQFELETGVHGTEVKLAKLEDSRIRPLIWGAGKASTKVRLGKIYGRVMAKLGVTILFDGAPIKAWRHCIWSGSRSVPTADFGNVPARIEIEEELPPRRFCTTCWVWLGDPEELCPSCGSTEAIIERRRRLTGWIGVQRYFDKNEYGFDLIRNGRVIQNLDKSLFYFEDSQGERQLEYPLDAIHWGGRLVGELEIDFVRVTHQKDAFDKLDPEWRHVVKLVRGESPLRPKIAARIGLSRNTSPLGRLYAGYRAGHAGLKELVPGDARGEGINTGVIKEWVEKFYAGEQEYQDDEKWYELVLRAERAKRGETPSDDRVGGGLPVDDDDDAIDSDEKGEDPAVDSEADGESKGEKDDLPSRQFKQQIESDIFLSRLYELSFAGSNVPLKCNVRKVNPLDDGRPYSVKASSFNFDFDYNPAASLFQDSLIEPVDIFLTDLAQHFLAVSAETPKERPVSMIETELREKYFPNTISRLSNVSENAASLFEELREHICEVLPSKSPIEHSILDAHTLEQVKRRALQAELADDASVVELIEKGDFAKYVDEAFLIKLVELFPDLVMDGQFFSLPYSGVSTSLRGSSLLMLLDGLEDTRWLAEEGNSLGLRDSAWRLRFSRALASTRLVNSWLS